MKEEIVSCNVPCNVENTISFHTGYGDWVMAIKDGKILFNRDRWPEASPDDFAKAVIGILEESTVDMDSLKKQVPFNNFEVNGY